MFPLSALVAHAELKSKARAAAATPADARRAVRVTRHGNLTLYPRVERPTPAVAAFAPGEPVPADVIEATWEDAPRVVASISNVSATGVGLILNDELPTGLQFDVNWDEGDAPGPVRFEVVHTKPLSAGLYRTGARLVAGRLPAEPVPTPFVRRFALASEAEPAPTTAIVPATPEAAPPPPMRLVRDDEPARYTTGVIDMGRRPAEPAPHRPAPAGTFDGSAAVGLDKTEHLDGVTTCGWERSVEIRRDGARMWVYIHSPGKRNGWGIFVDAAAFEGAVARVQAAAGSPFIATTMAA